MRVVLSFQFSDAVDMVVKSILKWGNQTARYISFSPTKKFNKSWPCVIVKIKLCFFSFEYFISFIQFFRVKTENSEESLFGYLRPKST